MKQKVPTSPFATRLSGSAKETELRLRNIFQWKKKRPPVIAFAAAVLVGWATCSIETHLNLVGYKSAGKGYGVPLGGSIYNGSTLFLRSTPKNFFKKSGNLFKLFASI